MMEAKRMKTPRKCLDVFEFSEEDELAVMAVKRSSAKIECPYTNVSKRNFDDNVSRGGNESTEIETGICVATDATDIDHNHFATVSLRLSETEDFTETTELSHVQHNGFTGMDMSAHLASDAGESMSERSPSAIASINASSARPSSHNHFSGLDLDDETLGVVFYADYLEYRGTHYLDSVVRFSSHFIEAKSKTIYGKERTLYIHLEVEDIIKIESQWSALYRTGAVNIYFISKDAAEDNSIRNASVSGVQALKFPAVDSDWYKKQDAIESLDMRYKALWSVLLDTRMENCSALPDGEATIPNRSYFPNLNEPFQEVIYPKGDPDAVSLSKRDVDLLLPDMFVNDTIVDFYIKYLRTRMNVDEQNKFHFFNSFFFRKLADMDKDPSNAFDGKAAFQRVRKWTRNPLVSRHGEWSFMMQWCDSYHWSLIVICYFGEVASYEDAEDYKAVRVPCVLHMDSLRGIHLGLKNLIQSYLWEEWQVRQNGTPEDLFSKFRNLKFIPLELPQQQNSYDCGLFLLHYIELFLEGVPADFSIYKITPFSKFLQADWFPPSEVSMKRTHIERLINGLLETQFERCTTSGGRGMQSSPEFPNNIHDHESADKFSVKSGPSWGCHERSPCEIAQGNEITLSPALSGRSTHCTRTSEFNSEELFEQPSAAETLGDSTWESLGNNTFSNEFITEDGMETGKPFMPTELAEPALQHVDGITQLTLETHTFPTSCEGFTQERAHQSAPLIGTSRVASGYGSVHIFVGIDI